MTYQEATGRTITEQFIEFHAKNPHVYGMMCGIVRQLRDLGFTKFSLETVWERMRWMLIFNTEAVAPADVRFKLNDVYASRYARLIMEQEADLRGFFKTRKLRSA